MSIKDKINKQYIFFDGAMGTMLQKSGLVTGEIPELMNIKNPSMIRDVHVKFLKAGADIITTNTFGASPLKLAGSGYSCDEVIKNAVSIAKEAVNSILSNKKRYVALDIGPLGQLLKPLGLLSFDDAYENFKEIVLSGVKYGVDVIIIETMTDIMEAKAAILAAKENSNLPVFCTMSFDESGRTLTGSDVVTVISILEGLRVDALGINCGLGPKESLNIIKDFVKYSSIPIIVQLNAGIPHVENGQTVFNVLDDEYANYLRQIAMLGVQIMGGCCGTTEDHIAKTVNLVSKTKFQKATYKEFSTASSYSKTVFIGKEPIVIGERINPTGKSKLKEALKEKDFSYIIKEALSQKNSGADILDINVGTNGINQVEMMEEIIYELQSVFDIPLQIDSSDANVISSGLKVYNGKAIINSVNGNLETMEAIFPLVAKYGGMVVALTLDDNGIPLLALDRIKIVKTIVDKAAQYGIQKKDILIDTLTLTASAQQKEVIETIKTIRMVKELGLKTILGVSNISFGLPNRNLINSTFLAMALYEGLDACIINPGSKEMMNTIKASNVLLNKDIDSKYYIKHCQEEMGIEQVIKKDNNEKMTLKEAIINGFKDDAYEITKVLLQILPPLDIIENEIVIALTEVGILYEKGSFFLPQLLQSAQSVEKCFELIKEQYQKNGEKMVYKGEIVVATVKGDIHDIGKNITKMILQNYGYKIIDLGKNVDTETILEAIEKNNIKLLGLSALMTTTVLNMESTIKSVLEKFPDCVIMVGGAVLTESYAKKIGAHFYAKDAMQGVVIANNNFK